jgi:DNA-binding transcriptional ArsR family regulator
MRPISTSQDPHRNVLNAALGAETHVRILRYLADADVPAGASTISRSVGVSAPGTRKALAHLLSVGVVDREGSGRRFSYVLSRRTALGAAVATLFEAERERFEDLIAKLRAVVERTTPAPKSAWIEDDPGPSGGQLTIGILHHPRDLAGYLSKLRSEVSVVERDFAIIVELVGYTAAEMAADTPQVSRLLYGTPLPDALVPSRSRPAALSSHSERSRLRAAEVAKLIEQDPTLVPRARRWLAQRLDAGHGLADADLREWQVVLEAYSRSRLAEFVRSGTPRADRLMRSSPFLAVLSSD